MRTLLVLVCLIIALPSFAGQPKDLKAAMEKVELIEGKPRRAYSLLSPLWVNALDGKKACDLIRVQAYKLGADAIIQLETGMTSESNAAGLIFASGGSGAGSTITTTYCSGRAVKWK